LDMWLNVNNVREQTGTTKKMIFSVQEIIAYLSNFIQLEPGDLICTGTPPGVGAGKKPPKFLKIGDEVHLGIDGLGEARQLVVEFARP
ncbi:MAG: fumarylacetoacetate hydrolase family protein, partial [Devosiaceae bacterium]|nr:fumarylacetoacetate hydrolase family protein [Devosiaceae bacterium]